MTRTQWKAAGLALGLGIALAAGAGRVRAQEGAGQPTVGEKVGDVIDRAGQAIRRGVNEASETVREGFARTRTAVHNMGVESRVYGRLHWDKALTDAAIELDASQDGVITLRGAVPSAAAKAKAITLTQETVGVTNVIDQMTIGPASTSTTTTTTTTTTPPPAPRATTPEP